MPVCEHCGVSKGLIRWNKSLKIYEHLGPCEALGIVGYKDINEVFKDGILALSPRKINLPN